MAFSSRSAHLGLLSHGSCWPLCPHGPSAFVQCFLGIMDVGEETPCPAEGEQGGVGCCVKCEILKKLRITAGPAHTVLPSPVDIPWSYLWFSPPSSFPPILFLSLNAFLSCVPCLLSATSGTGCDGHSQWPAQHPCPSTSLLPAEPRILSGLWPSSRW